jgi:hypothetical protein
MIEPELTLNELRRSLNGEEVLAVPRDDPELVIIATKVSDDLGTGPPVLIDAGRLIEVLGAFVEEGRRPLVILWTADLEELGKPANLICLANVSMDAPGYVFGSPTLCFMSRKGPFWNSIPKRARAVYQERYRMISEGYIEGLRRGGLDISSVPVRGELGEYFRNGMADIGIGMLRSEEQLIESGSWPLDRIISSYPIIVGLR